MRIDAHQHFWDPALLPYPWMPPDPSPLRRPLLPELLAPVLAINRFDGSILVQAATVPEEADWLLSLADQHDFILGVVAWADLTDPRLGHILDRLQRHPKFKGIRHPVHDEADDNWLLRPEVLQGLDELARRNLPYDLLLYPKHLPLIPQLADRVPNLQLVLDHLGKPPIASRHSDPARSDAWAADLERAAAIPQLSAKISGLITEADHATWTAEDLKPYVQHALACFTPDRLMFGSDWPVCLLAGNWKRTLAAFTQAHGPLNVDVRAKLVGETAMRVYSIAPRASSAGG